MDLEQLRESLEKLRLALCAYTGGSRCDCKYIGDKVNLHSENGSGCCEIRVVQSFLRTIDQEELNEILSRPSFTSVTTLCVRWSRPGSGGWCALKPGTELDPRAFSDETLCGHFVTLRIGSSTRAPTCKDCVRILECEKSTPKKSTVPTVLPTSSVMKRRALTESGASSSKARRGAVRPPVKKRGRS